MENLAQYRVNIPLTFEGYIQKGFFKKRLVPYSFTVTNDNLKTIYHCNARSTSRVFKRATKYVQRQAENIISQMKERENKNEFLIITGDVPNGRFEWSKPFVKITGYKLGVPEIHKIKDWKDATMKELSHSRLSLHEFQEVFDQIRAEAREKEK